MIVGVDEVGRGPLVGEVVTCALRLKKKSPFPIKDSKALTPLLREEIFSWLVDNAIFSVGIASSEEIDEINILHATFLAFNRAIKSLIKKDLSSRKATFIVDGTSFITDLDINYVCMKKADEKIREVAFASIVAKVVRDHLVGSLDFLYPQWKLSKHKGYPTAQHYSLIEEYSVTPFHRRSFSLYKGRNEDRG